MTKGTPAGWLTMDTAPKDGRSVHLHMPSSSLRAFWSDELKEWVLDRPLNMDYARDPLAWRPTGTVLDSVVGELTIGKETK